MKFKLRTEVLTFLERIIITKHGCLLFHNSSVRIHRPFKEQINDGYRGPTVLITKQVTFDDYQCCEVFLHFNQTAFSFYV